MHRTSLLVGVLLLALAAPPALRAQTATDSLAMRRLQMAESYRQAGQLDRAIALLEDLYAAQPEHRLFFDHLKTAYEEAKRYDEALALVEERLARHETPALLIEKAQLLHRQGREQAARDARQAAIAQAPDQPMTYQRVYHSLIEERLFNQAIEIALQGREALSDSAAFHIELAYLYSLTGRHEEAIEEYLRMLDDDDRRLGFVQRRLGRFMDQEEALKESLAATSRAVRAAPEHAPYRRLLAWLYLEGERYAEALEAYRVIDRLEAQEGRALFAFAQRAADAHAYEAALEAYQEVLARYPEAPMAAAARHGLGLMHERWAERLDEPTGPDAEAPHYRAALDAYETYLENYPDGEAYPEVLRRVGRLQQDVLFDLDAARRTLEQVARRYPHTRAALEARFDLGRLAVLRGRLDDARRAFTRLMARVGTGEMAHRARYQLALLHLYRGAYDEARAALDSLGADLSSDAANDALRLRVLLLEGMRGDTTYAALDAYARVRLQQRRRRPEAALAALDSLLAAHGRHPLADDARFLRARTLRTLGRYEDALEAFAEIPLMYPQSALADQSLLAAAALYEHELNDTAAAAETYNRLLRQYPGSLLTAEARERLRALQGSDDER